MCNIWSPSLPGTPLPQQTHLTFHMEIHQDKGVCFSMVSENKYRFRRTRTTRTALRGPIPLVSVANIPSSLLLSWIVQWAGWGEEGQCVEASETQ